MQVKGIVWLGTRTRYYNVMTAFCRDVLGMEMAWQTPDYAGFDLPNGDRLEIFNAEAPFNSFIDAPVAGFLVDNIYAARAEMEQAGVVFLGPVYGDDRYRWSHFRAPDGNLYELLWCPGHPALRAGNSQ